MSQEFLLKTPVASAAPKAESTKASNQPIRSENTDEPSFSSTLDKQVEQNEPPKKEPVENVEKSANPSNKNIKEKITKDEDGNILPENIVTENKLGESTQEAMIDPMEVDLDTSIVTGLKAEPKKSSD